jgi:hypothetical protein
MAEHIKELAKRIKGSLAETEDWWNLYRNDDGELYVEHSWSHTKLKGLTTDSGEKEYTIEEFLAAELPYGDAPKVALREYLNQNS